ncbi:MAG TPA: hypothetical protein VE640_00095, partial [Candidatus Bathyarchaeia archaeon]|nr:hypothetical protein [Candidatus Bathyarchaeia archaeon]
TMTFGTEGTGRGQFSEQPGGMVIDGKGRLFVDQGPMRDPAAPGVLVFDPDGRYVTGFGSKGPGPNQLRWPSGMLLDKGTLYVNDGSRLQDPTLTSYLYAFRLLPPLAP